MSSHPHLDLFSHTQNPQTNKRKRKRKKMLFIALLLPLLLAPILATSPPTLISKRKLPNHSWEPSPLTGCPGYLSPETYVAPRYLTQISSKDPTKSFGPQYTARFTPNDISTLFTFDIPRERANSNCTLEFLFPYRHQLRTSSFDYRGGGTFFFKGYNPGSCPGPDTRTTFDNQPDSGVFPPFPPIHMEPGHAYTIDVGPCSFGAGSCVAGVTSTNDTYFSYFQDVDECPIGIYTSFL
ncbi:GPI anchored cell wall protein [Poronia punctata]|nr:GPI anchored cell wall protein [Poronia punctata]